jgi:NodT family efflux transporter outer membrane factor (OMF) lipoprotein
MKRSVCCRGGFPAALLAALIALSGCTAGPDYVRPESAVPDAWRETAGQWKPAEPNDGAPRGKWWTLFADPGLDALEEQLDGSNLTIAQAEAQWRGAKAAARGARGGLYPSVTTSPSATRAQGGQGRISGSDAASPTVNSYQLPVDATWEIDLFGKIRRTVESSEASADAFGAQLEAVRLSMQAQLAADWFLLRGVDAQRQLLSTTVASYEKALELTTNRYRQGVVSGVDVAQAKTQVESTRAQAVELELSRTQLEHAIAVLVGKPPAVFSIEARPLEVSPPDVPSSLPSELLEMRPDIAAAERRVAAANAQIGVAKAAYYPSLVLSAAGGYQASSLASFFSLPNRFWSLGPALVGTLFDGGRRKAVSDQAVASYDASVAAYRATVLGAFQEVEDNLAALRLLSIEAGHQAEAVTAAERALSIARNRYQVGVTIYLEVVTAQVIALANERAAVDLATRRMTASVNLVRALGGGWKGPLSAAPAPAAETTRR